MVDLAGGFGIGGGGGKIKITSKRDVEAVKKRLAWQKEFLESLEKQNKRITELEGAIEELTKETKTATKRRTRAKTAK